MFREAHPIRDAGSEPPPQGGLPTPPVRKRLSTALRHPLDEWPLDEWDSLSSCLDSPQGTHSWESAVTVGISQPDTVGGTPEPHPEVDGFSLSWGTLENTRVQVMVKDPSWAGVGPARSRSRAAFCGQGGALGGARIERQCGGVSRRAGVRQEEAKGQREPAPSSAASGRWPSCVSASSGIRMVMIVPTSRLA